MVRLDVKFVCLALMAALPLVAQDVPKKTASSSAKPAIHRVSKRKPSKPVKPPEPPVPQPIPVMTPEQLPAAPPQVSYLNGQLTVQSENATLGDVLNAIRKQTGASIDIPQGSANERVAARLGPAPARDVITQLLAGSKFDYIILGSNQYPGAVDKVLLTLRQGGPVTASAAAPNISQRTYTPPPTQAPPPDYNANPDAEDESAPDTAAVPNPPPDEEQPPQPQPNQQPEQPDQNDQQQQQQQNPGVKTPEQLFQELQRMQRRDHSPNTPNSQPPGGQSEQPQGGQPDQSQGAQGGSDQTNPPSQQ